MDASRFVPRRWARTALSAGAALVLLTACTTGDANTPVGSSAVAVTPGTGLFDATEVHDIDITFDQDEYDALIDAYVESGSKEWITAMVTIDGTTFEDVGLRLKGNSSLGGLRNPAEAEREMPAADGTTAEEPESLPWLVRLDENIAGQSYEGITEFVVRSNNSETSLNEAVALELVGLAGLATEQASATSLSVNGSDEVLRLVVENPNDAWDAANFDTEGVLYKAESTGDYSYRGDDPAAYEDVFDQETDQDAEDLTPLIDFLDFINNSDDATFEAELGDHLDIDSFATYLAVQDLIENFDDIDGPGNNSYLRYDQETGAFTVVTWDLNLAFGSMGGGGGFVVRGPGGEEPPEGFGPPEGFEPPGGGGELPEDFQPPTDGMEPPTDGGGRGPGGMSNILVERFTANETWAALIESAKAELTQTLYGSGAADEILDRWSTLLSEQASDLVSADVVEEEASTLADFFTSAAGTSTETPATTKETETPASPTPSATPS